MSGHRSGDMPGYISEIAKQMSDKFSIYIYSNYMYSHFLSELFRRIMRTDVRKPVQICVAKYGSIVL